MTQATEILSRPSFTIPTRTETEWGDYFCDVAATVLANSGGVTTGAAVQHAIRTAASLTEALIELSEAQ